MCRTKLEIQSFDVQSSTAYENPLSVKIYFVYNFLPHCVIYRDLVQLYRLLENRKID